MHNPKPPTILNEPRPVVPEPIPQPETREVPADGPTRPAPIEAIGKMLTAAMDIAVRNGANSVSMPDEYVEIAAWLAGVLPARTDHPMQPFVMDGKVIRFKENPIVRFLLDWARPRGMGLNELACIRDRFTDEDRAQFAQLIGYSLHGWGTLPYVSDEAYEAACKLAPDA